MRGVMRNEQAELFTLYRLHVHMGRLEAAESFKSIRNWVVHLRSRIRMRRGSPSLAQRTD